MLSSFRTFNYFLTRVHELHFRKELTTYDQVFELKLSPNPIFFWASGLKAKFLLNWSVEGVHTFCYTFLYK